MAWSTIRWLPPLALSLQLGNKGIKGRDVLVWQRASSDSLPGNMQLILKSPEIRTKEDLDSAKRDLSSCFAVDLARSA